MGFFKKPDPLAELQREYSRKPKDGRLAQQIGDQFKAKGDKIQAVDYYLQGARNYADDKMAKQAIASAKLALALDKDRVDALEIVVECCEVLKLKEEQRAPLNTLRRLYGEQGRPDDVKRVQEKLTALGPGR